MEAARFREIQRDIPGHFGNPEGIAADGDLDFDQKTALLKQWEFDLRQMMVASEENMTDDTANQGQVAETLRHVRRILSAFERVDPALSKEAGGTAKAGGQIAK
ncbi:MAG: hypothetical protein ACKVOI_15195 [Dongiaceae bacterium]